VPAHDILAGGPVATRRSFTPSHSLSCTWVSGHASVSVPLLGLPLVTDNNELAG
jgi:hypothetical protein